MSESDNLDATSFQAKVLEEIKTLQSMVGLKTAFERAPSETAKDNAFEAIMYGIYLKMSQSSINSLRKVKRVDELTTEARAFLKERETREMLCPVLSTVEESLTRLAVRETERDADEIASAITPLLFPLARGASISLPLEPVAFALCAWILARTGIKSYCAGVNETEPLSL